MLIGHLALTIAALFTGAAIYVSAAEQPARLGLDDRALLREWKPSYKRGAAMQASLALLAFLLGMIAWWQTGKAAFLIGALFMLAPWPWTLLVIKPTNDALLATESNAAGPQTRALIVKWGKLHLVRTALGALGVLSFLYALAAG
jgi:Domain of unknown function (DUF1772)